MIIVTELLQNQCDGKDVEEGQDQGQGCWRGVQSARSDSCSDGTVVATRAGVFAEGDEGTLCCSHSSI